MTYIAHISDDKKRTQTVQEHCKNVAAMAGRFSQSFGFDAEAMAVLVGNLHDIGKCSTKWQRYIRGENNQKLDHSSAGAQEVNKRYKDDATVLRIITESCIAGHHAGLLNVGAPMDVSELGASLYGRLSNKIDDYRAYRDFTVLPEHLSPPDGFSVVTEDSHSDGNFSVSFLIRMLFSCLVDADFLDTEAFMTRKARETGKPLNELSEMLRSHITENGFLDGTSGINRIRSSILQECIRTGQTDEEMLYTLTVPTGGGKTVSSMAFAMEQAIKRGKDRIIYVIPYCSIIDQTADTFEKIFGVENVLCAFSNADYEGKENLRLASENWDAPIVLTTAVQFFESLYGNRTSKCRKLHNIANSVLVFDEAQTIPLFQLLPCIRAMKELMVNYQTICVLCTATQPALQPFFDETYVNGTRHPIIAEEICSDPETLRDKLKRVTYKRRGRMTDEEVAEELSKERQALCIVSTKKQAVHIYSLIENGQKYHLSTNMTPTHRRKVLKEVRDRLKDNCPCILVSTSLIEAGVDVDFPAVYRACAGLDSEIQAAGRCNREGKRKASDSIVNLFVTDVPDAMKPSEEAAAAVTKDIDDIADYSVVHRYYELLYNTTGDGLDIDRTIDAFEKAERCSFPFADVAKTFHLIDSDTDSILIPDESSESRQVCYKLENDLILSRKDIRFINLHSVNVYPSMTEKIRSSLRQVAEKNYILSDRSLYNEEVGLILESKVETFFV